MAELWLFFQPTLLVLGEEMSGFPLTEEEKMV